MDARRRRQVADLAWHGLMVFVSALLVTTAAGDYLNRLRMLSFWQEVTGSAGIAVLSQLLGYVALRMCPGADPQNTTRGEPRATPGTSRGSPLASTLGPPGDAHNRSGRLEHDDPGDGPGPGGGIETEGTQI